MKPQEQSTEIYASRPTPKYPETASAPSVVSSSDFSSSQSHNSLSNQMQPRRQQVDNQSWTGAPSASGSTSTRITANNAARFIEKNNFNGRHPSPAGYRRDYSRAQHDSPKQDSPMQESPKQSDVSTAEAHARFSAYVNRFASHDPRSVPSPPLSRKHDISNGTGTSVSERIQRFQTTPPRSTSRSSEEEHPPKPPHQQGQYRGLKPRPQPQQPQQPYSAPPKVSSSGRMDAQVRKQRPPASHGNSSNNSASTASSQRPRRMSGAPPPRPISLNQSHSIGSDGDVVQANVSADSIGTRESSTVQDIKKQLWDNDETLQVQVKPSLPGYGKSDRQS